MVGGVFPFLSSFRFFLLFLFFSPFFFLVSLPVVSQLVTIWFSVKIRLRVENGGGGWVKSYLRTRIAR